MKKLMVILGIIAMASFVYASSALATQDQNQGEFQGQMQGECQGQNQDQDQTQSSTSTSRGTGTATADATSNATAIARATAVSDGDLANISVSKACGTCVKVEYSNRIDDGALRDVNGVNMVQQVAGVCNDVGQTITVEVGDINPLPVVNGM